MSRATRTIRRVARWCWPHEKQRPAGLIPVAWFLTHLGLVWIIGCVVMAGILTLVYQIQATAPENVRQVCQAGWDCEHNRPRQTNELPTATEVPDVSNADDDTPSPSPTTTPATCTEGSSS